MATIEVTESGARVSALPGDTIVVRLPENATTGFQWSVEDVGEALEAEFNEFLPPTDARPGGGGERRAVFRAARPGHATVTLRLQRAWEPDPTERFHVDVTVG